MQLCVNINIVPRGSKRSLSSSKEGRIRTGCLYNRHEYEYGRTNCAYAHFIGAYANRQHHQRRHAGLQGQSPRPQKQQHRCAAAATTVADAHDRRRQTSKAALPPGNHSKIGEETYCLREAAPRRSIRNHCHHRNHSQLPPAQRYAGDHCHIGEETCCLREAPARGAFGPLERDKLLQFEAF